MARFLSPTSSQPSAILRDQADASCGLLHAPGLQLLSSQQLGFSSAGRLRQLVDQNGQAPGPRPASLIDSATLTASSALRLAIAMATALRSASTATWGAPAEWASSSSSVWAGSTCACTTIAWNFCVSVPLAITFSI